MLIFRLERVTDTMGRMHSEAQFPFKGGHGFSTVPPCSTPYTETLFRGVSFLCYPLIHENIPFHGQHHQFRHFIHKNGHFYGRSSHLTIRGQEKARFSGRHHQFQPFVHENACFRGYAEQNDTSVHEIGRIRGQVGGFAVFVHETGSYHGR